GGLAVALSECCFGPEGSFGLEAGGWECRTDDRSAAAEAARLFGEDPSRIVLATAPGDAARVERLAARERVPIRRVGTVGPRGAAFRLGRGVEVAIETLREAWQEAIPRLMERPR
ncbi:MAG: hypothetical protein ABR599_05655, partial [Gemmatimonadota bacterium]